MKRLLFRIIIRSLTVLSLMLCVATCADWSLSQGSSRAVYRAWGTEGEVVGLASHAGGLYSFFARPGGRPTGWTFDREDGIPSAAFDRAAG